MFRFRLLASFYVSLLSARSPHVNNSIIKCVGAAYKFSENISVRDTLTRDCNSRWIGTGLNIAGELIDGSTYETAVAVCRAHIINIQITIPNDYVFVSWKKEWKIEPVSIVHG